VKVFGLLWLVRRQSLLNSPLIVATSVRGVFDLQSLQLCSIFVCCLFDRCAAACALLRFAIRGGEYPQKSLGLDAPIWLSKSCKKFLDPKPCASNHSGGGLRAALGEGP
jgi:hypothetical protein